MSNNMNSDDSNNHNKVPQPPLVTPLTCASKKRTNDGSDPEERSATTAKRKIDLNGPSQETEADTTSPNHQKQAFQSIFLTRGDDDSISSDRSRSPSPAIPMSQRLTQEVEYAEDLKAGFDDNEAPPMLALLEDCYHTSNTVAIRKDTVTMGRSSGCDIHIVNPNLSRTHCSLTIIDSTCYLTCSGKCWIEDPEDPTGQWKPVDKGHKVKIDQGGRFRLLPPGNDAQARSTGVEFRLTVLATDKEKLSANPGSHSFDIQYLELLHRIQLEGVLQSNKKGANYTLSKPFVLDIDLGDPTGLNRNILPLTSLRSLGGGRGALIEALWYLRGEDTIEFLKDNKCHFWDKQATKKGDKDSWVGWNYGLLTHFPQPKRKVLNQLEERVVQKLCKKGTSSRNMSCVLDKPGEGTVQGACTSSIQFSVSKSSDGSCESLDLTIFQRSSDVMVGLPFDVVVWSIILHLVRREVKIRSKRTLLAGTLSFIIGQNAAHVYQVNQHAMETVLKREPIKDCQPCLTVEESDRGIFDLATYYDPESFHILRYTKDFRHPFIKLEQAVEEN